MIGIDSHRFLIVLLLFMISFGLYADLVPKIEDVESALLKAVQFFHREVSIHGGYLWQYSGDLTLKEAEGKIWDDTTVWVQPPGTPKVGEAFLDAYEATGNQLCLDAAIDAANVLIQGQMRTGGWSYKIELDPKQGEWDYRNLPEAKVKRWGKATVIDDDVTQSAIRFLSRIDGILGLRNPAIHDATLYALESVLLAQYPNGGWFSWWEHYPEPSFEKDFPIKQASYPEVWFRKLEDLPIRWTARYVINDDLVPDMIRTLLGAWDIYHDERYLVAAKKAGDFLLIAQMPDPQPAWAQQYDIDMHPCWGRKFEPPAIASAESQTVMESLLILYRRTHDRKYLDSVYRALWYLRKLLMPDGSLSRFYELQTNRPLFFNSSYDLTYNSEDRPSHYKFIWESRLDAIETEYESLLSSTDDSNKKPIFNTLSSKVMDILKNMDNRGAWVEEGSLRFHNVEPESGVINCQTFADNVRTISHFLMVGQKQSD